MYRRVRLHIGVSVFSKELIKHTFNAFGFYIVRIKDNPGKTLLGLCNLPKRTIIDVGANEGQFVRIIW
ncbi:MAG: hypothetical protein ACK4GR_06445, partial [bacterium]